MTTERDRLEDLNIAEALGRGTPPDLTARILNAANGKLEDAPTPISGAHSVPRNVRPQGRRHTAALPRRNWQGAGIAAAFTLLLAIGLTVFIIWKDPEQTTQQDTAEQPANQSPLRLPAEAPAKEGKRRDAEPTNTQTLKPENPVEKPKPDDAVEHPKPDPKPDDEIRPPEPDDTVEKPKPDDGTSAEALPKLPVVASFRAEGRNMFAFPYLVRDAAGVRWEQATARSKGLELDEKRNIFWVLEGTLLKVKSAELVLINGAQLYADGELSVSTQEDTLLIKLIEDDLYIDNQRTSSTVHVKHGSAELVIANSAALLEASRSKLDIFCVEGEISVNGTVIPEGFLASHSSRGLSKLRQAGRNDWNHPILGSAPSRHLGVEEFEVAPAGKMIRGRLETRTAQQLGEDRDGHVAVDTGRDAAVGFGLDGGYETLRGEFVRVRYRVTGASKLVVQLFCPARNDNFGIDLAPGKEGEWHVLEIKLSDLRDRETHKDAPPPGTNLSSFTIAIEGKNDAQLEVDWVEFAREPRFGE